MAGCGGSGGDRPTASSSAAGGHGAPRTPAGARAITVVRRQRLDTRLEEWTLRTRALADPARVRVLLPARYRADAYRTVAARRGRAVAGLSMGGYGALSYAARHPRTFAAAASFSGAVEIGPEDAWGPRSGNEARWRAHLPISIAGGLRSLALTELFTGDGRPGPLERRGTRPGCGACALEADLQRGNVRLHRRLRALGIRHTWDDYGPGTHDWPYWRRDRRETLPDLVRVLARA